ncbi:hypothetical protein [Microbacterium oleivorans]|uniref:hypothetical protein n=1 Tax=Microbacterium oleivorans TaxID=273677 RepID=UPI000767AAD7|nr:hypothetical protein [Microbacterium oleivorans]AZS45062.1 hypothetical protein BWL13_02660 [Microbacterium oleivorans]
MPRPSTLSDYLDGLSAARRDLFARLSEEVAAIETPEEITRLVFRAGQTDHPEYDDAEVVFWKAVDQLYLQAAVSDGDLPILFWGFHTIDLLGRRHSKGVLVTDRTVYVEGVDELDPRPFSLASLGTSEVRIDGAALRVGDAAVDLAPTERVLAVDERPAVARYVSAVIDTVRGTVAVADQRVEAPATVEELVLASRLSSDFLLPSRPKNAKGIAKLAAKWKLPASERVLVSLSSATFVGVYGIAITDAALYSRDLMEDLDRTPLDEIGAITWDAEAKGFRVTPNHLAPTLPGINDDNRDYVAALLTSLVRSAAHTG